MRILYLIPARKGSKGLPGKNTKLLGKKPLVEYSLDFAIQNCALEDEICISTDDGDVINIAEAKGLKVPFIRPENLSDDKANMRDVILHALQFYEDLNQFFHAVLLLQPTSPFRKKEDIVKLKKEFSSAIDMVVSVKKTKENPYFTLFEENQEGFLLKSKSGNFIRRQDCPEVYSFNGSMYLINTHSIQRCSISEFKQIKKVIMPEERSIDIDTFADWVLAEYFLKYENS